MRALAVALLVLLIAPGCMAFRSHDGKVLGLKEKDPEERYDCLLSLAEDAGDDPDRLNELCEHALRMADLTHDLEGMPDSVPVRLVALRILGRLGKRGVRPREVAQKLANHARKADEPEFWCRVEALSALGSLLDGPQNVQPDDAIKQQVHEALVIALSSTLEPDRDVRIHAARELARLRPDTRRVLEELVNALSDEAPDVRLHAQRALIAIAGDDHGPTREDWKAWVTRHIADQPDGPR